MESTWNSSRPEYPSGGNPSRVIICHTVPNGPFHFRNRIPRVDLPLTAKTRHERFKAFRNYLRFIDGPVSTDGTHSLAIHSRRVVDQEGCLSRGCRAERTAIATGTLHWTNSCYAKHAVRDYRITQARRWLGIISPRRSRGVNVHSWIARGHERTTTEAGASRSAKRFLECMRTGSENAQDAI